MSRTQALVLAGHGSQRHRESAAPLHDHADRIRGWGRFDEVRTVFWKEEPPLWDVRSIVGSDVAYVVPVLTSEGYFADDVFPRELGLGGEGAGCGPGAGTTGPEVRYAEPVGTHEAMTNVIADRVECAVEGPHAEVAVALVGHGTERNDRSAISTVEHARCLRRRGRYAAVHALFLDEEPHVSDLYDRLDAREVVVVPLFVADGHHTTEDVPAAIDHPGVGESAVIHGRHVHYAGAVGTEPSLAEVIVERAVEAGASVRAEVSVKADASVDRDASAGGRTAAGNDFIQRVDAAADGLEWGDLWIAAGPEGYELRHREDATARRGSLRTLRRPRDLRRAVRTDDRGRYRPLSGARTLPTGWTLAGLGSDELVRAVRYVYPASVAHWWRARRGELDVTHFEETAARQTGVYADLDGFDGPALDAAAEAVCGDCVRRRRWDAGPDEEIDARRGDGPIPCRAACPFLLSAAHAFKEAAREGDVDPAETVNGDVTPAAFEEAGNRYRVRFARALAGRRPAPPVGAPMGGDR